MKKVIAIILALMLMVGTVSITIFSSAAEETADAQTGATTEALGGHMSTNPNGQVGVNKTISVDGDISDWDMSMLIAQGVANDDPRVYKNASMHENPIDSYALYAAWDNNNLYLMWEMKNVQDLVAPGDDYPLTQGLLYQTMNVPMFIAFNTGKSTAGDGTVTDGSTIWGSGLTWEAGIDTFLACSTNGCNGPFIYKTNSSGKFEYNETNLNKEVVLKWGNGQSVDSKCIGIDKAYGKYNNRTPGDILDDSAAWVDFYAKGHKKSLDFFYEMSIPFSKLGIDKAYLESHGIGVMQVMTYGTSGMNSLPVDLSMTDNATKDYSKDPSSSMEKEDEDNITVPLAQIGSGDIPTPGPSTTYKYGDANLDDKVDIKDATLIQQYLAGKRTLDEVALKTSSIVDGETKPTVKDTTAIQQYLSKKQTTYSKKVGTEFTM